MSLVLLTGAGALGQDFTLLHSFAGAPADGAGPWSTLVSDSEGNLYGTTESGPAEWGTVYQVRFDGREWTETVLHAFEGGIDGRIPRGGLLLDAAGNIYGTTEGGGLFDFGTVFQLSLIDGRWTKTVLYHFTGGAEGGYPSAPMAFDADGQLIGTGWRGGATGNGTVFQLTNTSGEWSATALVSFDRECSIPTHGEVIFDTAGGIYGMTQFSAPDPKGQSAGCIYRLSQHNGVWTREVLHVFSRREEGGFPTGGLIFDGEGNLYGLTDIGGMVEGYPEGRGTVFQLAPPEAGWQLNVLHIFGPDPDAGTPLYGSLVLENSALYGTTYLGGSRAPFGIGAIFKVEPGPDGGWVETVLHSFQGPDGYQPIGGLLSDGRGTLYGTASKGGAARCGFGGCGTVYQLNVSP